MTGGLSIVCARLILLCGLVTLSVQFTPNEFSARAQEGEYPEYSVQDVKKVGQIPSSYIYHKENVADKDWFRRGAQALDWLFRKESFETTWPLYAYESDVITSTCSTLDEKDERVMNYKIGYGVFISATDEDEFVGYPLTALTPAYEQLGIANVIDYWKELGYLMTIESSDDISPGQIELERAGSAPLVFDVLKDKNSAQYAKFEPDLLQLAEVYAASVEGYESEVDIEKSVFNLPEWTLQSVCDVFSDERLEQADLMFATKYPVLDGRVAARLVAGKK